MWAEKEMRNLIKMAKGGIRVPEVVILRKHVLLMSFIGQVRYRSLIDPERSRDLDAHL